MIFEKPQALAEYVGREIGVTEWMEVSQDRISAFAEATGDAQWIHVDAERARRESPFGTTVAHGFLTLSLLSGFVREAVQFRSGVRMAINYGLNRVRIPAPLKAGARVRALISVLAASEISGAVEATFHIIVEAENSEKPCCVADWIVRYYR